MSTYYESKFMTPGTSPVGTAPIGVVTHALNVTGSGTVSATVIVEGSNFPNSDKGWTTIVTLVASGTSEANDTATVQHSWRAMRVRCTAVTGLAQFVATGE